MDNLLEAVPQRQNEPSRATRTPEARPRGHGRGRAAADGRVDTALRAAAARADSQADPRSSRGSPGPGRGRAGDRAPGRLAFDGEVRGHPAEPGLEPMPSVNVGEPTPSPPRSRNTSPPPHPSARAKGVRRCARKRSDLTPSTFNLADVLRAIHLGDRPWPGRPAARAVLRRPRHTRARASTTTARCSNRFAAGRMPWIEAGTQELLDRVTASRPPRARRARGRRCGCRRHRDHDRHAVVLAL